MTNILIFKFLKMTKILFFLLAISGCVNAMTKEELGNRWRFAVGVDLMQPKYKETAGLEFDNYSAFKNPSSAFSRIAWNISYRIFETYPVYIGARTNKGLNFDIMETVYSTQLKKTLNMRSRTEASTLYLATALHKRFIPFVAGTFVENKSTIYFPNQEINTSKSAFIYGFGASTFINKKIGISLAYYFQNKELNTENIIGLSFNYYL